MNINVLRVEDADGHGPIHGAPHTNAPQRGLADHVSWLQWHDSFFFQGLGTADEDDDTLNEEGAEARADKAHEAAWGADELALSDDDPRWAR